MHLILPYVKNTGKRRKILTSSFIVCTFSKGSFGGLAGMIWISHVLYNLKNSNTAAKF